MNALNDGGDQSRLEVDYSLGGLRDTEDEVLDEVRDPAVGDDEQPGDGPGNALGEVVALGGATVVAFSGSTPVTGRRAR